MKNITILILNLIILLAIIIVLSLGIEDSKESILIVPTLMSTNTPPIETNNPPSTNYNTATNAILPTLTPITPTPTETVVLTPTATICPSPTHNNVINLELLNGLDTKKQDWWFGRIQNGKLIYEIPSSMRNQAEKFGGIYRINEDKKVIYLTFDEGYENGYTEKILDVLKDKNVKVIFFVTGYYIKTNPDLVKRMINDGHLVGNHTDTHPKMPLKNIDDFIKELSIVEKLYNKLAGEDSRMYYYRPPEGCYSERDLCIAQQLGYKSVFWSFAYLDYDVNNQKGNDYALNTLKSSLHNGEVILLHAVSKDNANILGDFIDYVRQQGYEIRRIDE